MGEDKSLLPFIDNKSLIQYQYERLEKVFQKVYISSKTEKFDFQANIILDDNPTFSPMVALQSIFNTLNDDKIFIITVDTPFVTSDTIDAIFEHNKNHDITIAQSNGKVHNLCGIFNRSVKKEIDSFVQNDFHKINTLIKKCNTNIVLFNDDEQFLNINTPDIYHKSLLYYKNN